MRGIFVIKKPAMTVAQTGLFALIVTKYIAEIISPLVKNAEKILALLVKLSPAIFAIERTYATNVYHIVEFVEALIAITVLALRAVCAQVTAMIPDRAKDVKLKPAIAAEMNAVAVNMIFVKIVATIAMVVGIFVKNVIKLNGV